MLCLILPSIIYLLIMRKNKTIRYPKKESVITIRLENKSPGTGSLSLSDGGTKVLPYMTHNVLQTNAEKAKGMNDYGPHGVFCRCPIEPTVLL